MEVELRIAVEFLLSFVVKKFKIENTEGFVSTLMKLLRNKFDGHWYPEHPNKGSGYRCISLCDQLDGILVKAANESGLDTNLLERSLPKRLDVWIDPREVSYRIGNWNFTISSSLSIFSSLAFFPIKILFLQCYQR